MEIWSQSRWRKNAAGLCAGDPAAPGRAVASGTREAAGIPGTRRGREEEESKSELRSLQVSRDGEGEGNEVVQGWHGQVTKSAALNSNWSPSQAL